MKDMQKKSLLPGYAIKTEKLMSDRLLYRGEFYQDIVKGRYRRTNENILLRTRKSNNKAGVVYIIIRQKLYI